MRPKFELSLPPGPFEGYVFDCDGTLIDSMTAHMEAWNRSIREHGGRHRLTPETFMRVAGVGGVHTVERFNEWWSERLPPERVIARKEEIYLSLLDAVEPIGEVVEIARRAARDGLKVAVASGGPREVVETALEKTGLRPLFPVVVTQTDVRRSKPDPEIFLLAAQRMGVRAEACLVFEDSPLGVEGATAAGMQSVLVPNLMAERARRERSL